MSNLATWFTPSLGVKSRAKGQSAVAAAAYRACTKLDDARTGKTHDYSRKGIPQTPSQLHGHVTTFTTGPIADISELWNKAEESETRKNSTVARELIIPLPHDWGDKQREKFCRNYADYLRSRYGVACQVSIHRDDDGINDHCHLLFTTRVVNAEGEFKEKTRVLDDKKTGKEEVKRIRETLCEMLNEHGKRNGSTWFAYAGKFRDIEPDHVPKKHIPKLAAKEKIAELEAYNESIDEYRVTKALQRQNEYDEQDTRKHIEEEEKKRQALPTFNVPVSAEPIIVKREPLVKREMPDELALTYRRGFDFATKKRDAYQKMLDDKECLKRLLDEPPPQSFLNRFGFKTKEQEAHQLQVAEMRESLAKHITTVKTANAFLNDPLNIERANAYHAIIQHNARVEEEQARLIAEARAQRELSEKLQREHEERYQPSISDQLAAHRQWEREKERQASRHSSNDFSMR
jgi:dsDNA-binding SOS-regulon protein